MEAVNLAVPTDRPVGELSGGQQARLLLANALIQKPGILLLDEPTNNLDKAGIDHLIEFLVMYEKTVIVISHDADFLNCFTDGVLYLDVFTKKIETYVGDYYSVVEEIENRIERERKKNAQLEKLIKDRKEKVNFFSHKGGKMRKLAKKMSEQTTELEENKIEVRKEDKTIRDFTIPTQDIFGDIVTINQVKVIHNHEPVIKVVEKVLITGDLMNHKILHLSEGQKGLLSFARLVLMQPGLLVFDEPTNHINFRHIPVIIKAINKYEGAMILISHMPEFVQEIKINDYLDLSKL